MCNQSQSYYLAMLHNPNALNFFFIVSKNEITVLICLKLIKLIKTAPSFMNHQIQWGERPPIRVFTGKRDYKGWDQFHKQVKV